MAASPKNKSADKKFIGGESDFQPWPELDFRFGLHGDGC
jgi:hypothetical protein